MSFLRIFSTILISVTLKEVIFRDNFISFISSFFDFRRSYFTLYSHAYSIVQNQFSSILYNFLSLPFIDTFLKNTCIPFILKKNKDK